MVRNKRFDDDDMGPFPGIRHLQTILFFAAIAVAYAMRVNLSVAIVAMTDKNSENHIEYTPAQKSLILSSFFWGYVVTQMPGGHFARKFGGKVSLLIGILLSSILAFIMPFSVKLSDWRFPFAVRVLQGMSQGVIYPSTHTLLAKWSPKDERALLGTIAYCGGQFGTVVMFAASGFLAASPMGWSSIFYASSVVGFLWVIVWYLWGSSSPGVHKTITLDEQIYIERSIANGNGNNLKSTIDDAHEHPHHHPPTPWMKIIRSTPFWALLVAHLSFSWAYWTMLTQIPSYMKNILGFDIKSNALLTSLPYLAMLIFNFIFSAMETLISKRKWLSLTGSRKFFNTLATWIPAVALAGLGYLDASYTKLAVALLMIAVGFGAAVHMGFMVNHIDLSPNFAGILMGVTNTVANFMSILAPLAVGLIVTDETSPIQWRIVFFVAAGFVFFGNLLFILYGSAEMQPFNVSSQPKRTMEEELKPMNYESNKS